MALQRKLSSVLLVTAALAAAASTADAKLQIGISEQSPNVFTNKYFKPLKLKYGRIVVPWNILQRKDYWPGYLKAWLDNAKAAGVEPMVAFNIIDVKPKYFGKGPTVGQYTTLIKGFRKKYPTVKTFTPWNEDNHKFQPTFKLSTGPKLAFQYYTALKKNCPGCKVLAADVLDQSNMAVWLTKYRKYFKGSGTWGLHNYQDANNHIPIQKSSTYKITKVVKGDIWSTEAGGLVYFKTIGGKVRKYNEANALKAQKYLFTLMADRRVKSRYKRVYIYDYFGTWAKNGKHDKDSRWDSGLIGRGPNGKPRPAYYDLKKRV